jgi:prepilin peptidase CpaA
MGESENLMYAGAVALFVLAAAVVDARTKKLPNWLTVPACLAGLVFHLVAGYLGAAPEFLRIGHAEGGWAGMGAGALFAAMGFAVGFAVLFPLFLFANGKAGDVKLLAALGTWVGWFNILLVVIASGVFTVLLSVGFLLWQIGARGVMQVRRRYFSRFDPSSMPLRAGESVEEARHRWHVWRRVLPYGLPVALGTWVLLAWQLSR